MEELVFYKQDILDKVHSIDMKKTLIREVVSLASKFGFSGNIWHRYVVYHMIKEENVFSLRYEYSKNRATNLDRLALPDFEIWKNIYDFKLDDNLENFEVLEFAKKSGGEEIVNIIDKTCDKLDSTVNVEEFMQVIIELYQNNGAGELVLYKAFRINESQNNLKLLGVQDIERVTFDNLIGYEIQKSKLIKNTEDYLKGRVANNCLLFGDAGTGKSSSIKALLNKYYGQGLRIIEVYKHQFNRINDLIDMIKNRNYKFIIYMDDLSFEEFEIEYKYLKAVIEGGLQGKCDNVLIYATSNRRHLIKESFNDRKENGQDKHSTDTVSEKLSLADRFGVTIYYGRPERKEYKSMLLELARRKDVKLPEDEILYLANQWELSHGNISGRMAQQFINTLV